MQTVDIDMYTECFILFDECEKLVQDVHYRDSIREPMNDFFRFQNKALDFRYTYRTRKGQSF